MSVSPPIGKVQAAEERSLRQLRLALSTADIGDWSWDPRTDQVTMSERTAQMFGVSPGVCATWVELQKRLHPEDRARVCLAVEKALQSGENYDVEYRVIPRPGEERWLAAKGRAVKE